LRVTKAKKTRPKETLAAITTPLTMGDMPTGVGLLLLEVSLVEEGEEEREVWVTTTVDLSLEEVERGGMGRSGEGREVVVEEEESDDVDEVEVDDADKMIRVEDEVISIVRVGRDEDKVGAEVEGLVAVGLLVVVEGSSSPGFRILEMADWIGFRVSSVPGSRIWRFTRAGSTGEMNIVGLWDCCCRCCCCGRCYKMER
jgi:hypothetical protein